MDGDGPAGISGLACALIMSFPRGYQTGHGTPDLRENDPLLISYYATSTRRGKPKGPSHVYRQVSVFA
jgi:hypothetical protein